MIKLFCDTNCELPCNRFDELNLNLIQMPYVINGEEFLYDLGRNIDNRDFFRQMREGAICKTSALNEHDYINYFEPVLKENNDILYISFSHAMSGTFNSMNKAIDSLKEKYPDRTITVVDTGHISMGAGLVVYYAAKLFNSGASLDDVVNFVNTFKEKVKCYFTVADLIYLKRGGRLSSFKAMMGTIFNVKPILSRNSEGKIYNIAKSNGRKKSLHDLIRYMEKDQVDLYYPVVVMNADNDDDTQYTIDLIKEKYPNAIIWEQFVGPVIGSHCGPDTIGLLFVGK